MLFSLSLIVLGRAQPHDHHDAQNPAQVRGGRREGAEGQEQHLLDERAARLTEGVPNHVDGGLALGLFFGGERDERHFLARVEERVPVHNRRKENGHMCVRAHSHVLREVVREKVIKNRK